MDRNTSGSRLVQQRTGQQIPTYKINYAAQTQPNAAFKTAARANQLNVIAPPQRLKPIATVQPQVAKQLGMAQVDRGWRNVPQRQAEQIRHQFAQQAPVPQTLPPKPVLPNKPQIQAVTKGQPPKPGGPGKGQQAPNGQLQPFIQKPGNSATIEQEKLEQQKLEAEKAQKEKGRAEKAENVRSVQSPKKPEVVAEQEKVASERTNGQPAEKAQVERKQQETTNAEHIPQKQATHEESPKGKTAVPKKERPTPPQAKVNQHAQYAVTHPQPQYHAQKVEKAHPQQQVHQPHPSTPPHVAQAPHPPPQPHGAASNNSQKKKNDHKG
jgi:hypothetical protein